MTLLLKQAEIRGLLSQLDYVQVVERAFRLHGEQKSLEPQMMHMDSWGGELHIKAGGLELEESFVAVKINGDYPMNPPKYGMPALRGLILLLDGKNGTPLAILDSTEITLQRTAAATAVAAKYLARPDSHTALICGCGKQGRVQLQALAQVLPLRRAIAYSRNAVSAQEFALELTLELEIPVVASLDLKASTQKSDVVVTSTRAKKYFLHRDFVSPGTFIAAVGADSADKQELDPELMKIARVVVDVLAQCAMVGELHHALAAGMSLQSVHAELSEIVSGRKVGRMTDEDITIFDSTGTAVQDVAAAAAVYKAALQRGAGTVFEFAGARAVSNGRSALNK